MITRRTLYPGQPGTKKWLNKYGKKLVCVRYRYDEIIKKKMITIELVAEIQNWEKNVNIIPKNKIVKIRIKYGEADLGRKVKSIGGKWNKKEKVWELRYEFVQGLGLTERMV